MTATDILLSQLTDPFRLGLIAALVLTMLRTEAVTGRWVPLALGVAFVAAIIPMTTSRGSEAPLAMAILLGLIANVAMLAVVMAIRNLVLRILR